MRNLHFFCSSILAAALAACAGAEVAPPAVSHEEVRTGEEWARCWTQARTGVLASTHQDVVCAAAATTHPAFTSTLVVVDGATRNLSPEARVVGTVRKDLPATVTVAFTTASATVDVLGVGTSLTRTIDLTSATEASPVIVASPFQTWKVSIRSATPFVLALMPYEVSTGAFTSSVTPLRVAPPPAPGFAASRDQIVLAPIGASIDGKLNFSDGRTLAVRLTGSADLVATAAGLVPAEEAPTEEPVDPGTATCGEPDQQCCDTAEGCRCNAFRVSNIFGICSACGDEGKKSCPGDVCRPSLVADETHVCR